MWSGEPVAGQFVGLNGYVLSAPLAIAGCIRYPGLEAAHLKHKPLHRAAWAKFMDLTCSFRSSPRSSRASSPGTIKSTYLTIFSLTATAFETLLTRYIVACLLIAGGREHRMAL